MTREPAPVGRAWFERPAVDVAVDLLGALIRTERDAGPVVLRVTEVEAYAATEDPASHAFRGKSLRNSSMYLDGGHLYVYRHLGLHYCVNVVTGPRDTAGAVLLRAGEVVEGAEIARARRRAVGVVNRDADLARGPARLAVALGLGASDDGRDLVVPVGGGVDGDAGGVPNISLILSGQGTSLHEVSSGPRVGVSEEGRDGDRFAWRFWLPGEPTVSDDRGPSRSRRSVQRKQVTPPT